jgi:hypothetical protein
MWDKVVNEKLVAKTNVSGVDLSLNDKGRISAKGKIGGLDVSANSDGHAQATGKIAGGTMSTAVNKDGDGGYAFNKGGKTVSHTAGARDAWVSKGPNQPSQRVALNNSKVQEDDHEMSDDEYQRILMRKSTSKSLGSAPPTYDQKKFDNYSKANKRGAYSNSKVRQSVDFDDDLDEEWYNPTTWFNDDDEDKLNSLIAQDKKDKKPSYRKGISSKTQNAICSNPDLKAMNPKACESVVTEEVMEDTLGYGFYTTAKGNQFALMFNDGKEVELVGTYDSHTELKKAQAEVEKQMRADYRKAGVDMQKPMGYDISHDGSGQYVATIDDSHLGKTVIGTYKTEKEAKWAIDIHNRTFDKEERMDTTGHELPPEPPRKGYSVDPVKDGSTEQVLRFNGDVIGTYNTDDEVHAGVMAHRKSANEDISEDTMQEWEIVINGNTYTTSRGETEDEAINNFWKAVVEKEGIKKFLGDMVFAQELTSSTDLDEDLTAMLRIAGLR